MKRIHYISGIIISIFVGIHLFNHAWSVFGAAKHIEMMDMLRQFYRNILIESLLLMAIMVQIVTGVQFFLKKRKIAHTFFERLHIWSGLYLAMFFVFHLAAVFGGRMLLHLDTNFYFGSIGLNTFPFSLFFIPYYGLAILSFFGHIAAIHQQKMTQKIVGLPPMQQSKGIILFGFLIVIVVFYGLISGFSLEKMPKVYEVLVGMKLNF